MLRPILLSLVVVELALGCVVGPVRLDGRACDEQHPCVDGYGCVDGRCAGAAPSDAGSHVDAGPPAGDLGGACYPNDTCNGVLRCDDGRCVAPPAADAGDQRDVDGGALDDAGGGDAGVRVAETFPAGLVAYWPLDGDALDEAGSYDGVEGGAVSYADGMFGRAAVIAGAEAHIDMGDIAELNGAASFTLVGWWRDDAPDGYNRHFTKVSSGTLDVQGASYMGRLYLEVGSGENSYAYWPQYAASVAAGEWHHLAFVFDGAAASNAARAAIYVDGAPVPLTSVGTFPSTTAAQAGTPFRLSEDGATAWSGAVDEVALYARALSALEIAEMHAAQAALAPDGG